MATTSKYKLNLHEGTELLKNAPTKFNLNLEMIEALFINFQEQIDELEPDGGSSNSDMERITDEQINGLFGG